VTDYPKLITVFYCYTSRTDKSTKGGQYHHAITDGKLQKMNELTRLGVGAIVFLIGAVIYIVNLVIVLSGRGKAIPIDGVGLMVLGLGLALLLSL
jgi:hypothetical protein